MKSTSRVRPNTSTKSAKSQAYNGHGKPARQYHRDTKIGLYVSYGRIGKRKRIKRLVEDIGLTPDEYTQACRESIRMRDSGKGNFFGNAIREKLSIPDRMSCLHELDFAQNQVRGLLALIEDHLFAERDNTTRELSECVSFEVSFHELAKSTKARLARAVHSLFPSPVSGEVAS